MESSRQPKATGWIAFAGVMLSIVGVLNVIDGIAALTKDEYYQVAQLLFGDLTTWGWIYLILGALQIFSAVLLFKSRAAGMIMAVTFASLSGIAHFLSIGAYPVWSVILMTIDFLIIFGLLANSDAFE